MNSHRLQKEQSFHDIRFGGDDKERINALKYYSVNKYLIDRYNQIVSTYCNGKRLLEYGCGTGSGSELWLSQGAMLTGIDISPEGIRVAKEWIAKTEYDAEYYVMDAENTTLDDDSFDIVVGTGIVHHLDLSTCFRELSRIIKNDGHAVFLEPLGHNPFINLYRALTPQMRTDDEHPLKQKDIRLLKQYFHNVEVEYSSLFTLLAVPFRNTQVFDGLLWFLRSIDRVVFLIPFLRRYAWMILIHASNPDKARNVSADEPSLQIP